MAAADGRSTDTARAGRANLITNYSFTRERLKGFNIGGAARWRAEPTIGYGVTTTADGAVRFIDHRVDKDMLRNAIDPREGALVYFDGPPRLELRGWHVPEHGRMEHGGIRFDRDLDSEETQARLRSNVVETILRFVSLQE